MPLPLYRRGTAADTRWIGAWVSPRAGLDAVNKINIVPAWNRTPFVEPEVLSSNLGRDVDNPDCGYKFHIFL
jgi:hypothetical protein